MRLWAKIWKRTSEPDGTGTGQDCLVAALTNRLSVASIRDPDLRILATNQPLFAVSWARKTGSGTSTNKDGRGGQPNHRYYHGQRETGD